MTIQEQIKDRPQINRAWWIGVLARAEARAIATILGAEKSNEATHQIIKPAETGTVMLEGRAGGTGQRFNLGEATVTRCVVKLSDGPIGVAYALGRDKTKAEHAAVLDAILQKSEGASFDRILAQLIALDEMRLVKTELKSRKAAATKVNFFTLIRGEG